MKRKRTGTYELTSVAGERVRAFVPAPLPPLPRIVFEGSLQHDLERATLAVGRLDGVSALLPDRKLFLYSYVRKEAVLSSQIEGTQSSLSDLLLFELDEAPGVPLDDVTEVSNYVSALEHGVGRIRGGFPLSNRLLREIHAVLLSRGRGSGKQPGEFRTSQNWIGGTRPGNAAFVPPPHTAIRDAMSDLERFLHADDDGLPLLARAAVAHVQFETIHPFLDGNGRVAAMAKTLTTYDVGYVGMTYVPAARRDDYFAAAGRVVTSKGGLDKHVESILVELANAGTPPAIADISGHGWLEIDEPHERAHADEVLKRERW